MARAFPDSPTWQALAYHQSHVEWGGCSVHDMIQPSFSFLVGRGPAVLDGEPGPPGGVDGPVDPPRGWRALLLIALGIFLRSVGRRATNYTFEDTLTQIGLGYLPLFLIGMARPWVRWVALGVVLVGYWGAFAPYPAAGPDFDYAGGRRAGRLAAPRDRARRALEQERQPGLGVRPVVPQPVSPGKRLHPQRGRVRHAELHPDPGDDAPGPDRRRLAEGAGGAGGKLGRMFLAAAACVAAGLALDHYGICPIVKRIWTPSWVLFSGGICFATLAVLYALIDLTGYAGWTYPLRVIGRNSIAAYVMAHLFDDFILGSFKTHLGRDVFKNFGSTYEPLVAGAAVLAVYWLILFWMDRRKIYLRV